MGMKLKLPLKIALSVSVMLLIVALAVGTGATLSEQTKEPPAGTETSESTGTSPEPETTTEVQEGSTAVEKTVTGFAVSYGTGASVFKEGQPFSSEGYVGTVLYSDGTSAQITASEMSFSPTEPLAQNNTSITFSTPLTTMTSTLTIAVTAADSLDATGSTYKDTYRAGEDPFDPTGITFRIKYVDGSFSDLPVPIADCVFTPALDETLPSTVSSVTASYMLGEHELTASLPVTVRQVTAGSVRIGAISAELREGYPLALDKDSLDVYATFDGDSTETKVKNFTVAGIGEPIVPGSDGKVKVTVYVDTVSASKKFDAIALDPELTQVTAAQTKHYYLGDAIDTTGITVSVEWTDGKSEDVTSLVVLNAPETYTAGSTVTASFGNVPLSLEDVIVLHVPSIEILRQPDKTEYNVGEHFDKTGIAAVVTYDDGTHQVNLTADQLTLKSDAPLTAEDAFATLVWNGLETNVTIKVYSTGKRITSILINKNPDKIRYVEGELLDLTGLKLKITYDDDTTEIIDSLDKVTTVPSLETPLEMGKPVVIRYNLTPSLYYEATLTDLTITQSHWTAIVVTTPPVKTQYGEGDAFSANGMVISAVYDNGKFVELPASSYSVTCPELIGGRFILKDGGTGYVNVSLSIKASGKECVQTVYVLPKTPKSLSLQASPKKTEYLAGERFDPTGMAVRINFTDGSYYTIPSDYYRTEPSRALTDADREITVTFRGQEAKVPINVKVTGTTPVTTPEVTTGEITTAAETGTDTSPDVSTPDETIPDTDPGQITTPEGSSAITSGETTTKPSGSTGCRGMNTIMVLWVVIIVIIVAALVGLVIYYKRNFT